MPNLNKLQFFKSKNRIFFFKGGKFSFPFAEDVGAPGGVRYVAAETGTSA